MNRVIQTDINSVITPRLASAVTSVTAGGTGDNTAITGVTLDRLEFSAAPLCASLVLLSEAVLADAATMTFKTVKIQDSADGSTFADYVTFTDPGVVSTGPSGGGTVRTATKLAVNLSTARRYIRAVFTPDMSASSTDTAKVIAAIVYGGHEAIPSPA